LTAVGLAKKNEERKLKKARESSQKLQKYGTNWSQFILE
jgi:hypothetical protein